MKKVYRAYGLVIHSEIELPGLYPVIGPNVSGRDIKFTLKYFRSGSQKQSTTTLQQSVPQSILSEISGDLFKVTYPDQIFFLIHRSGQLVEAHLPYSSSHDDMATYLQGPVLGLILRLHGMICLHASVITLADKAYAFVGPSGIGKSTLAAAMTERKAKVLSDDILVVKETDSELLAQPGYPRLRLWPESVSILRGDAEALPLMAPRWEKRYLDLLEDDCIFERTPRPLSTVYLCSPDNESLIPQFTQAENVQVLMSLVENIYPSPVLYPPDKKVLADSLQSFTKMVKQAKVKEMKYKRKFDALPILCDHLLKDISPELC